MPSRVPSLRRFAAGALASIVAVFGVLALRVHGGDDPALASKSKSTSSSAADTSSRTSSPSGDSSSSSAPDPSGWSSGAPTTRAS